MAPTLPYPRSTLRTLLKTWSPSPSTTTLSSNFDALAYVAYLTFLQRLAKEARGLAEGDKKGRGKAKKVVVGRREIRKAKRAVMKSLKA